MAGVGKILKQAQRMQKRIEEAQAALANEVVEVSHGGGAIKLVINGHSEVRSVSFDPEFLKEDKETIEQALLAALNEATAKAKALHQSKMSTATEGFALPSF